MGNTYTKLGENTKAIEFYQNALNISDKIGDIAGVASCYVDLGIVYNSLGEYLKAIELYQKALESLRQTKYIAGESRCYINLGNSYFNVGEYSKSYENLVKGIDSVEKLGKSIFQEDYKIGFQAQYASAQNTIIPVCYKLDKKEEMFGYLERSKSKALLEILSTTDIKPPETLTKDHKQLIQKEEECNSALKQIQMSHIKPSNNQITMDELDKIIKNREAIYEQIENISPECSDYVSLRRGNASNLCQIQKLVKNQNKKTVVIEYFIYQDIIYIFIVSSGEFYIEEIPFEQEKFNFSFSSYFEEVVNYPADNNLRQNWLQLSDYLIRPIQKYLNEKELIYFIPYGILHYLPLHALQINDEPIIKNFDVCYAPSSSVISHCKAKGTNRYNNFISFGTAASDDSEFMKNLFEQEAVDVAKSFKGKPYCGNNANKITVLEKIKNQDIIHFSCHSFFDTSKPLKSGLLLHNDEILTAEEIFKLDLNSELITLSACETGLSENKTGDELIGLTRALLYAGTPSVVVSLWSVHAIATKEFMIDFYKNLQNGQKKSSALKNAQLKLMENPKYSHPFYWAPFILVGDWE